MRGPLLACALALGLGAATLAAETPKRGGTLTYLIPADGGPSLDGHRETTYAVLHATAPFYSTLVRVNPDNPSEATLEPRAPFAWFLWLLALGFAGLSYYTTVHG